jgi:two-component system, cell cycle response regulator
VVVFNARHASAASQSAAVLLSVLKERDRALGVHVDHVALVCRLIGERLGLGETELDALEYAAALHDVGKAAIPDAILSKPGPLNAQEFELIRQHTVIGERIVGSAPALAAAAMLVRSSHERLDGLGYPDALTGTRIPLGARIITVADSFDAMTSDRPYRRAMSQEDAVQELRYCTGTQFDPGVVRVFVAELEQETRAQPAAPRERELVSA